METKIKNVDDVKQAVKMIEGSKDNPEIAHSMEDDLYYTALHEIANGNPNAVQMAKEALKTQKIDFARWCS